MLSFRKKLMSQSRENLLADGRTDGRMDGPYFIGPFQLRSGSNNVSTFFINLHFTRNFMLSCFANFWSPLPTHLTMGVLAWKQNENSWSLKAFFPEKEEVIPKFVIVGSYC